MKIKKRMGGYLSSMSSIRDSVKKCNIKLNIHIYLQYPKSKAGLQKRMQSLSGGEFIQFYTPQIDTQGLVVED